MSTMNGRSNRRACLAELRRRIDAIERGAFDPRSAAGLRQARVGRTGDELFDPLGTSPIDRALPDEIEAKPALQELVADGYGSRPAVRDFSVALAASLLHRQADTRGMVLWCQRQRDEAEFGRLYGPGLQGLGLAPDRLIMVTGRRNTDCLWAMEQGLASRSFVAVIGAVDRVDLIASRRLSLAASAHRTCCLLLPSRHGREPSAARTRWRVRAAPSIPDQLDEKGLGRPCWQLTLERNRHGRTGHWTVEWDHAAHRFHLAAPMGNQPVAAARRNGPDKVAGRNGRNKQDSGVLAFDRVG